MKKIGVLALQGNVKEHLAILETLDNVAGRPVRTAEEIREMDGLILPGGESTTIGMLMERYGIDQAIREKAEQGMAVYGTCAGLILMAKDIENSAQQRLNLMDIKIRRNAFGRQVDSFETSLDIKDIGAMHAVFIRAPVVLETGAGVEILAEIPQGIVVARQGNFLASSFHPELTPDARLHRMFVNMIKR